MRVGSLVLMASLACPWSLPAQAEPAADPALLLQQQASKASAHGDHRGAIRFLEKAYEAEPATDTLLEIAEQYDALLTRDADPRDIRLAIVHYRQALATEQNALERKAIEERLQALQQQLQSRPAEILAPPPQPPPHPASRDATRVPPTNEVRISFVAENSDDAFSISVAGKVCQTPCAMVLAPGNYVLTTGGAAGFKLPLLVPETDGVVRIPWSRRSYLPAGVLLTVLGPIIAGTLWLAGLGCPGEQGACLTANFTLWPIVGTAMLGTGIGLLASYGNRSPDRLDVEPDAPTAAPAVHVSAFGLQPIRNGLVGSVGFSF